MAFSSNGTVVARLAGGLYNTVLSNATYLEVATQDPSTLANTLYSRDFAKSTDLSVATTLLANLGLSAEAGLDAWVAAQLTAAGAANKGAKIVSLLNDFAGLTADAKWGTYATSFNTKVDAALAASQKDASVTGVFASAGTVAVANATFTLTTGVDTGASFTGGAGNDTFTANNAALGTLDSIDGGAGTDTLTITDSVSIPALNITAVGIETLNATSTAGSIGSVAADAKIAAKQQIKYTFNSTYGTSIGVGPVKVTVGGASITVGTETSATAQTIDKIVTAINQLAGSTIAANSDSSNTGATGTIVLTAATAGTALPTITFANGSFTPGGTTTAVVPTTDVDVTPITNYSFPETVVSNQAAADAVTASTFTVPAGVTTATLTAAASLKAASVSTAATTVSGTDITLSGGASQTVTSSDSVYASGSTGPIVITNSTTPATGFYVAATTSGTGSGIKTAWGTSATSTQAGILVTGGSTVNVTSVGGAISSTTKNVSSTNSTPIQVGSAANYSSSGSTTGTETIRNKGVDPTGDVTITNLKAHTDKNGYADVLYGTGAVSVYTNGSSSVTVKGAGTTTITDINTQTLVPSTGVTAVAGTSKLTSVTLAGLSGDATITSDAITTVTVTDTLPAAAKTVYVNNSGTTGANSGAINLVVSNAGTSSNRVVLSDATATSVNVSTAGASAYQVIGGTTSSSDGTAINSSSKSYVTLTTAKATSVTMTNALSVDIGNVVTNAPLVGTINASGATGAVTTIIGAATAYGMAFTGGSGKDSVTLTGDLSVTSTTKATSVALGAGDDKLLNSTSTAATTTFTGASFDGGDGNDTVAISLLTIGNASKFTNFETLGLDVAATASVDLGLLAGITGYSLLAATSGQTVTYTGAVQANALTVGTSVGSTSATVLDFGSTVSASTDAYKITFAPTGATTAAASSTTNAGTVTITGIEAVTIESGGSGYTTNTIALKDANARTLTITGAQKSSITFDTAFGTAGSSTSSAGLSLVDASAATAKVTINIANAATAYAGLTIKGGSDGDAITLDDQSSGNGRVTVESGAGDDVITTKAKSATLTGGSGNDSFVVTLTKAGSSYASAPEITTITDFTSGDTITMGNTTVVSTKTTGAANVTNATSLLDAFAKALYPTGGSYVANNTAVWFIYGADTYIIANDTVDGFSANDMIVKLAGVASTNLSYGSSTGLIGAA